MKHVLDIGCGAGQEVLPLVETGAKGCGIDLEPAAGRVGREMFAHVKLGAEVEFVQASGTRLPFKNDCFDVVICRVALMYMDNRSALSEIGRVLKRPGRVLLKYHAPAYYWAKLSDGIRSGYIKSALHAARVLYAGYHYYLTGRQPFNLLTAGGEMFQTRTTLQWELAGLGMQIGPEPPDTNRRTPSLTIIRP